MTTIPRHQGRFISLFICKRLPPYTLVGFDLTTHSFSLLGGMAGGDDTARVRRQGKTYIHLFILSWANLKKSFRQVFAEKTEIIT
jgi:hypothetical protein